MKRNNEAPGMTVVFCFDSIYIASCIEHSRRFINIFCLDSTKYFFFLPHFYFTYKHTHRCVISLKNNICFTKVTIQKQQKKNDNN